MYKHLIVAMAAGAMLALATPVFAQSTAPQAQNAPHHHWMHHGQKHARHERAWPFAHALRKLDLSDAQKEQIRGYLKQSHETIGAEMKALHADRRAFVTAMPGTPEFTSAYQAYSVNAAHATQARIQQIATLHTNIYNLLTAKQQRQLGVELAAEAASTTPPQPSSAN